MPNHTMKFIEAARCAAHAGVIAAVGRSEFTKAACLALIA
jgi:hypothetical protein